MEPVRLSKRMAEMGLCSRREADSYIEQGWVKVNGSVAVLGQKVVTGDDIQLDKKMTQAQERRVTILINKPMGYVSGQAEMGYLPAAALITPAFVTCALNFSRQSWLVRMSSSSPGAADRIGISATRGWFSPDFTSIAYSTSRYW